MHFKQSTLAAVMMAAALGSAHAESIYATTAGNALVNFDSANPGITTTRLVTGLAAGEALLGIDFRPATGELFGLGSSDRLYTINVASGVATPVGTASFTPALAGTHFGFDFNPTVDRIRITSDTAQNLRANPLTGAIAGTDAAINPTGHVTGSAYDRNDVDPTTPTTLFVIDSGTDRLLMQGGLNGSPSPNLGALTLIGALGVDTTDLVGFDISGSGAAFAVLNPAGSLSSGLYSINLATGAATWLGDTGLLLTGVAVAPVPLPSAAVLLGSALLGLGMRRRNG